MPDHSVLGPLNWPDPAKLGVLQWSLTDDETLTSTVATLQRTDDAIRARVVSQDFDGGQKALFCAVWSTTQAEATLTHHKVHEHDLPLDPATAIATFQDYVNTIGQRPRFTYAGDAAQPMGGWVPAQVQVGEKMGDAQGEAHALAAIVAKIPRTPRF